MKRVVGSVRLPFVILCLAMAMLVSTMSAPASAAMPVRHPVFCVRGNMDDGLIVWRFVTLQYGVNYYKYHIHGETEEGNGNCLDNPDLHIGLWTGLEKCIIGGILAIVGTKIPGVGRVKSLSRLGATGCVAAIL